MKYFIRFKLRNLTVAGLALIMAATFAVPFFAYPDQLMADTQDDLDAVNKQLEELRNKQSELNASYGELNEKLSASGEKLSSIEDAVNAKQSEIDATNIQVADMQAEIDQQYASMKLRIQFMYENNNATILSTLLSAESLSDLLSKSEYIQQISNYDHQKMQELSDLLASLKETQAKLEEEMTELVTLKDDAAREADNFAVLLSQCQTELDTTSDSITDAEALALEYEKQIEQEMLERQRREMEALEAARKAQEEADKANNAGNTGGNSSSGSAMVDQNALNNVLKNHTAEDVAMLAAIIECEAGNQSYEGKCAVGSVVINRVADPRFANSISGVIYAPYQFSPVASGRFAIVLARGANAACTQAAIDVLNGYININALYFMYMTVLSMWAEPLSEIMYFTNSLNIPRGELLTMKKATKASDNRYYQARFSAAQKNTDFESREAASDVVGIDRTRLARIELGNVTPYADEVVSMSKCYNAPELCYNYCSNECPIGRLTMKEVEINSFDRLSLKMLGSLNDIENLRASIINISADGQVDIGEQEEFKQILESLDLISNNAKALELWAKKNIKNI